MTTIQSDELVEQGEQFLEHYGVKGMRWGVRRKRGSDGRVAVDGTGQTVKVKKKTKIEGNKAHTKTTVKPGQTITIDGKKYNVSTTKASDLSTKELQEAVNRMNLEQQYSRLTTRTTELTRGQRFAQKMADVPMEVVVTQTRNVANALVSREIEKRFNIKGTSPKKDDD